MASTYITKDGNLLKCRDNGCGFKFYEISRIRIPGLGKCRVDVQTGYGVPAVGIYTKKKNEYMYILFKEPTYTHYDAHLSEKQINTIVDFFDSHDELTGDKNMWEFAVDLWYEINNEDKPDDLVEPDYRLLYTSLGYRYTCDISYFDFPGWGETMIYIIMGRIGEKPVFYIESIDGKYKTGIYFNKPRYYLHTTLNEEQRMFLDNILSSNYDQDDPDTIWESLCRSWYYEYKNKEPKRKSKPDYTKLKRR